MNIPYFMCRNIEQMTTLVQKKNPEQQHKRIYHYALIKMIVVHQLGLQGIAWEDFIAHEFFTAHHPPLEIVHGASEPSHQFEGPDTEPISVPVCVTYQRGTRALFAATRRVLSPPGVEGVSLPSSAARVLSPLGVEGVSLSTSAQVQDRCKKPMHDEGPSRGQDTDFILIVVDSSSPSSKLKEIIQEQKSEIDIMNEKLQRAQWVDRKSVV